MRRRDLGFGRAFTLLLAAAGLAACVAEPGAPGYVRPSVAGPAPIPSPAGRRVAILLPLTGPAAETGQALLRAAQISLDRPGAPPLDAKDTGGTPVGAAEAARQALADGAGLILGPLTAGETAAVAPIAKGAGVAVLAFTSDIAQAQPGVWTLGITPAQQVRRLVLAVQGEGKQRITAVLPMNAYGDAMAAGLGAATSAAGLGEARVVRYAPGFSGINAALKDASDYDKRHGAADAAKQTDADKPTLPSPPMDALLLGTAGDQLGQAIPLLAFYDIGPGQVRIMGPALWARDTSRLSAVPGAWYAAPDPALRGAFEQRYTAKYNTPPRELASLAYDAAGIAAVAAAGPGFRPDALARPAGYAGADGLIVLHPDGSVRRGLAIFEVDRAGAHIVQPSPQTPSAPGV